MVLRGPIGAPCGPSAMNFKHMSDCEPRGDQPEAIAQLSRGIKAGEKHQVPLGVTGSGKRFTGTT
jgi:excinuclease ABC subunit B